MKKQNYQLGLYNSFAGATGGLKCTTQKACKVYLLGKPQAQHAAPLAGKYNFCIRFKAKALRNRITSWGSITHLLGLQEGR